MYSKKPYKVKENVGGDLSATTPQCDCVSLPVESSSKVLRTFHFPKTDWSFVIEGAIAPANNNLSSSVRSSCKISRLFVPFLSTRQSSSVLARSESISAEPRFFSIHGSFIQKEALSSNMRAYLNSELILYGQREQIALSDRSPHIDLIEHS